MLHWNLDLLEIKWCYLIIIELEIGVKLINYRENVLQRFQSILADMLIIAVVFSLSLGIASADIKSCPKLCSTCPCVEGVVLVQGIFSYPYEAYLGIPYAKKPINELRFKNPMRLRSFPKILIGEKQKCIQRNVYLWQLQVSGSEDCLYMNIYRSTVSSETFVHLKLAKN
jgi:Carboxylesterase family